MTYECIYKPHMKLDNVTLNVYHGFVSSGSQPGGRTQERTQ